MSLFLSVCTRFMLSFSLLWPYTQENEIIRHLLSVLFFFFSFLLFLFHVSMVVVIIAAFFAMCLSCFLCARVCDLCVCLERVAVWHICQCVCAYFANERFENKQYKYWICTSDMTAAHIETVCALAPEQRVIFFFIYVACSGYCLSTLR